MEWRSSSNEVVDFLLCDPIGFGRRSRDKLGEDRRRSEVEKAASRDTAVILLDGDTLWVRGSTELASRCALIGMVREVGRSFV